MLHSGCLQSALYESKPPVLRALSPEPYKPYLGPEQCTFLRSFQNEIRIRTLKRPEQPTFFRTSLRKP